jgi:multimeric flavodoxin WrbA
MKNVLILSGSPRKGGNSDLLCDEFARGAAEAGNTVEKINVADRKIGYCRACYYCYDHDGECAVKDDMAGILDRMEKADVIVMASPVYFYSIDAQMKALIDRTVARWTDIRNKEFYYIATCAAESDSACDATIECFRGFVRCLRGSQERGIIRGTGVYEPGEIKGKESMERAYQMGRGV